jgi:hypothetical protein
VSSHHYEIFATLARPLSVRKARSVRAAFRNEGLEAKVTAGDHPAAEWEGAWVGDIEEVVQRLCNQLGKLGALPEDSGITIHYIDEMPFETFYPKETAIEEAPH